MKDDTISRAAAIKSVCTMLKNCFNASEEMLESVKITVGELPSAQQWIPCSERMPEANEKDEKGYVKAYLVQDACWMDVARWDGEYWVAWGYGIALRKVVAWMPLPAPYKGDEDG